MSQLAIVGNGSEGEVVINCKLAGLAFFQSQEIKMRNVTMLSCGAVQNQQHANGYSWVNPKIQMALLFKACKDVRLTDVSVIKSNGTGIVLYNPVGKIYVDSCQFIKNELSCEQAAADQGGGGLVIEANDILSQTSFTITNSNFTNNTASSGQFTLLSSVTINPSSGYFGLGRGGGISVVFGGTTSSNTVQLNNVRLEGNRAQFGAGLFLALYGNTSNNTVSIGSVMVMENKAFETSFNTLLPSTSGGGALIEFAATGPDYPSGNTIDITSSRFISNAAEIGGGLTVSVVFDSGWSNADNKLLIENCTFNNNKAFQGSSVYLTQSGKSQLSAILNMAISDSNFTNGHCVDTLTHGLPCLGSVLLRFFPLTINGVTMFTRNSVSALSLRFSSIKLLSSTQLQFISNSAVDGAALHIVDCSSLVVNSGTSLVFRNNTASHHGGAIYSETCNFEQAGGRDCFIRHSNSTLHPDKWNISVTFTDNLAAGLGNSIYTDSIQSCIWPNRHLSDNDKLETFCWKGWSLNNEDECLNQLRSGPSYITGPTHYTLFPGDCIDLTDFIVHDDWGNDITNQTNIQVDHIFGAIKIMNNSNWPNCLCSLPISTDQCIGYDEFTILCPPTKISLVSDCSHDYANNTSKLLIHPHQLLSGIVLEIRFKSCDNYSKCDPTQQRCTKETFNPVCNHNFTEDCRIYPLCGSCTDYNYGIAINIPQFTCVRCEATQVAIFIFLQLVSGIIMMVLLTVLHVNITNGNLNGYVLYSQIVSLQFPIQSHESFTAVLAVYDIRNLYFAISLIVYSIWNLNFLTIYPFPLCLPYIDTAAEVILLQYVTAACPLLFILVSYTWIQCYNNGYRCVVTITRPVHQLLARFWQKFDIKPSLIDTYAGLILLSYMRFLAVSVKLLQVIVFYLQSTNYEHLAAESVALAVLAILCLLVFVVLPMAILLLYHHKIFQRCLTRCKLDRPGLHAVVDTYQGCFKNSATDGSERRYIAGIYLLFRFCYVAIFLLPTSNYVITLSQPCLCLIVAGLVVILQPYKKAAHNVIDFLLLFSMIVASAISATIGPVNNIIGGAFPFFVPFLAFFVYVIYRLIKSCCACVKRKRDAHQPSLHESPQSDQHTKPVTNDEYIEDDLYADRILNPDGYKNN